MASETLQLKGQLLGHNGWVTQIATNPKYPDMILSSSRGESVICINFDLFRPSLYMLFIKLRIQVF